MKILTEKKFEDRLKAVHAAGKAEAKAYYDDQLRLRKNAYDRERQYERIASQVQIETEKLKADNPEYRVKEVQGGFVVQKRKIKDNVSIRSYSQDLDWLRDFNPEVSVVYETAILEGKQWKVFNNHTLAINAMRIEANPRITYYTDKTTD